MTIVWALIAGWMLLALLGRKKGYTGRQILSFSGKGIRGASNVLLTLSLVGILTGLWRACGTISYIVTVSTGFISLRFLLIEMFLLCCLVSFLIGTSFGTVATVGVICMIIARSAGFSPTLAGGAILSGIYFGDRCSYISSSAMLVASVSGTELYDNVKGMMKTGALPFGLTCLIYLIPGIYNGNLRTGELSLPDFSPEFAFSALALLPAVLVLVLAILRVKVRIAIILSSLSAAILCLFLQHMDLVSLLETILFGYKASHQELAGLINGGGVLSMWRVLTIVCISSTYAGIFQDTGLLDPVSAQIKKLAEKTGPTGCLILLSVITSMIGCNQTLAIMLTSQFGSFLYPNRQKFALALENTVVVIAPLIPWCIAGAVPVATLGVSPLSFFAASYLYLLPIWELVLNRRKKEK